MIKTLFIAFLIFLFFSCNNQDTTIDANNISERDSSLPIQRVDSSIKESGQEYSLNKLFEEVDVNYLKNKYGMNSTSGVLSKKTTHYINSNDSGFFGVYYFPNPVFQKNIPFTIKLVIFSKSSNWKFSDTDEILVEITNYSSSIPLFSNINVGDSLKTAQNILGDYLTSINNIYFFVDKNTVLSLKVTNKIVSAIRIGKYNFKEFDEIKDMLCKTL